MFGFKKKDKVEFEATRTFGSYFQYDENRQAVKIMATKKIIPVSSIETFQLNYGNKVYTKKDFGSAIVGTAMFGVIGAILAGTHSEEYISNMNILIRADGKFYSIPLLLGKHKLSSAKGTLRVANEIIEFLDGVTTE